MKIINIGSLCIDHVYEVSHFVRAGETLAARSYQTFAGGKGLNQSVAIGRAGAKVLHAGKIGSDGRWLLKELTEAGADISFVEESEMATGHGRILITPEGENSILIYGGANKTLKLSDIDRILSCAEPDDILLLQNEINLLPEIIEKSYAKGLKIAFNPAPFEAHIHELPLEKIHFLILNHIEGGDLIGEKEPEKILKSLVDRWPDSAMIVTLGENGVIGHYQSEYVRLPAIEKTVVDTTAAGDTFVGYFIAAISQGENFQNALELANCAAGLSVTRKGAAVSIPDHIEVGRVMSGILLNDSGASK